MSRMNVKGTVFNTNNSITDEDGYAIPPIASNLGVGQFAVNTSETDPCIFFKTSAGKIVKIVSEEKLTKALTDILGNSAAELDTLRELIAQFEGSANDIIPLLTDLKKRVISAEANLGIKANKTELNSHTENTSNPHRVTKEQVGLSAVLNKEQLGKTETAADSTKLGGILAANYVRGNNSNRTTTDNSLDFTKYQPSGLYSFDGANGSGLPIGSNCSLLHVSFIPNSISGFQILKTEGHNIPLMFRTNSSSALGDWHTFYGTNNANLPTVNWTANKLTAKSGLFEDDSDSPLTIHRTDSDNNVGMIFQGKSISRSLGVNNGELKFGDTVDLSESGKTVWHSGNSNKSNFNWITKNLDAFGTITCKSSYYIGDNRVISNSAMDLYIGGLDTSHSGFVVFRSKGLERLRISNNGNIGINNTNPTESLDVNGNGLFSGSVTAKGDIVAMKTDATVFTASDEVGGATRLNDLLDIKIPEGLAAKMVLAYDPAQLNTDGTRGGYTFMPSAGTGTGTVSAAEIASLPEHNHNDIVYASDERLKENVIPLRNATIMLNNLRPKEYNWNETGRKLGLRDPKAYGLIAQEVEVLREIIDLVKPLHGGESGYLGVDYVKLVPVLVAGFQEQHSEIIETKNRMKSIRLSVNKAYSKEVENARKIEYLENKVLELETLLSKR